MDGLEQDAPATGKSCGLGETALPKEAISSQTFDLGLLDLRLCPHKPLTIPRMRKVVDAGQAMGQSARPRRKSRPQNALIGPPTKNEFPTGSSGRFRCIVGACPP
jgi:hypothetical protein